MPGAGHLADACLGVVLLGLHAVIVHAAESAGRHPDGGGGAPGAPAFPEEIVRQLLAAAEGEGAWDSLLGRWGGLDGQGEQKISPRRLQYALPQIQADLLEIALGFARGQNCVDGLGVPAPISTNITDQLEPVKLAMRPGIWHRRNSWFVKILMSEFYRVPIELVELRNDGSAVQDELLSGTVDLDIAARVELPQNGDPLDARLANLGDLGYSSRPGIYASPSLVAALNSATPNMTASQPQSWFTSYRALASQALLNLLPPVGPSTCKNSRCFIPAQCQGANITGCRMVKQEDPMFGGNHTQMLVETYRLPLVIVYVSGNAWLNLVHSWNVLPPTLVASVDKPSSLPTLHRFQFPHGNEAGYPFAGTVQDWSPIDVKKLARRNLEMRLPDMVRWFLQYDFARPEAILSVGEAYLALTPWFAPPDTRFYVAACYEARQVLQFLAARCFVGGAFSCHRESRITCPLGEFPSQVNNRWYCSTCPVGTYCPPHAEDPLPCPNGTTSLPGRTSIEDCRCMRGFRMTHYDSQLSVASCSPCPSGQFKNMFGNLQCNGRCPRHSSSEPGATGEIFCGCAEGFFLQTVQPWRCVRCLEGAACEGGIRANVSHNLGENSSESSVLVEAWRNHTVPVSRPGFYGYKLAIPSNANETYSPYFLRCPVYGACVGDNTCSAGTTGDSCRVCQKGFRRDVTNGKCVDCDNLSGMIIITLARALLEPLGQLALLRIIAVASKDSAVLTPIIIKINGLFFLAARTCIRSAVPSNGLRAPNGSVIRHLSEFLMQVISYGSSGFEIDVSTMSLVQCVTGPKGADVTVSELLQAQIWNYRTRMIEVLLMPILWPISALVVILSLGLLMFNGDTEELPGQLGALKRMEIIASEKHDERLGFAQVAVEDARRRLVEKNSLAGVWRPFTYEWDAQAVAEERPGTVRRGCLLYLQSYTRNLVSMFMPFWFFHYLGLVKNCLKAVFGCNRSSGAGSVEWWHGFEPAMYCFSSDHYQTAILGGVGLVIYGLGIPILVWFVVRRKMKFSEDWCNSFNVNGYTFWGWITVYWDVVLLLKSAFLSFVESLPPETFQSEKELFATIICSIGMVMQSAVEPFDKRRNNTLNRLEESALATATLINPLLIAAVEFEKKHSEVGVQFCLAAFSLLIMRFLYRVLMELVREARDAIIQFRKQAAFASMIKKKKEQRQISRQNQQKQWLREMLAAPKRRNSDELVLRRGALPPSREGGRGRISVAKTVGTVKNMMGKVCTGMVNKFNPVEQDDEDNDGWSDFSEEQPGEVPLVKKRRGCICRCVRSCAASWKDIIDWLGGSFLLSGMALVQWMIQKLYQIFKHREEMQNRFGLVYNAGEEQSFTFEGATGFMIGEISDLWQREQVVSCFESYMQCLLYQHGVQRLPANLPKAMLSEALNMGSTNKRSLKWKAMTKKVNRLLSGICSVYINTKQDEELIAGLSQLNRKMQIWLNFNDPSGRLVKVQHLEAYILHTQFAPVNSIIQSLTHAAITPSRPQKVDLSIDKDGARQVQHEPEEVLARMSLMRDPHQSTYLKRLCSSRAADWEPTEQVACDVLTEGVPTTPSTSHLVDYWHRAHLVLSDNFHRNVQMYSFWDPLQDPSHPRVVAREDRAKGVDDPTDGCYTKLQIPGRPCDSALTLSVDFCKEYSSSDQLEPVPWSIQHDTKLHQTIMQSPFLDIRLKHAISRVHTPLAFQLLRILGKQHDMLRTCREGLTTQVVRITKEVENCRARAARKGAFKSEVLESAEGLILAVGLRHGSKLFEQLSQRLAGGSIFVSGQSWQQSHAKWFEAAAHEWMREFTARWTPWGVPVFSAEESLLLHNLAGSVTVTPDSCPGMEDVNAWLMWRAMQRRDKNMRRARAAHDGTCALSRASGSEHGGLATSVAGTPAGVMMLEEDWAAVEAQLQQSGGNGKAFAKQLSLLLEERRQIMLDWSYSVATRFFKPKPLHTTKRGHPYCYELENFDPGLPTEDSPRGEHLATEEMKLDLDRCRRAFGLAGFDGDEIVWCSRGLHELSPMHDLRVPTDCSCDICDAILGRDREGLTYCCLLCNRILCASCAHLASFLSSDFDDANLQPVTRLTGTDDAYRVLDRMELVDPCHLMDELNQLEGRLYCTVTYDGVELHCQDIRTWAQQRVLSGNSLLSMLLCREGRHVVGFAPQIKGSSRCSICGVAIRKRTRGCGLCCNCDVFLCERCHNKVQYAEYLRTQISHCWRDGVLDDETRGMLCMQLKASPIEVLDVLYRVLGMRDSDKSRGWHRDLSLLVHRSMSWSRTETGLSMMEPEDEPEDEPGVHRAVGPDKVEAQSKLKNQAVQAELSISTSLGHTEQKRLVVAQEEVLFRRTELQDQRLQPEGGWGTSQWAQGVTRRTGTGERTSAWRG